LRCGLRPGSAPGSPDMTSDWTRTGRHDRFRSNTSAFSIQSVVSGDSIAPRAPAGRSGGSAMAASSVASVTNRWATSSGSVRPVGRQDKPSSGSPATPRSRAASSKDSVSACDRSELPTAHSELARSPPLSGLSLIMIAARPQERFRPMTANTSPAPSTVPPTQLGKGRRSAKVAWRSPSLNAFS
jgi:hypothetical protein